MIPEILAVLGLVACVVAWLTTLRIYHTLLTSRDAQLERLVDQIVSLVEKLPNVMSPWLQAANTATAQTHERESAEGRAHHFSAVLSSEAHQNLKAKLMRDAGINEEQAETAVNQALSEFGAI